MKCWNKSRCLPFSLLSDSAVSKENVEPTDDDLVHAVQSKLQISSSSDIADSDLSSEFSSLASLCHLTSGDTKIALLEWLTRKIRMHLI